MTINMATKEQWDNANNAAATKLDPAFNSASNPIVFTVKEEQKGQQPFKLPDDAAARKAIPIYTGVIKYFPRAIAAIAQLSLTGGIQHGQTADTLHWDRNKSGDEKDALMRHIIDEDWDQVAWRALANLEKHLEGRE